MRKFYPLLTTLLLALITSFLGSCVSGSINQAVRDGPPQTYINVNNIPNAKPHYLPKSRYGNPTSYVVDGKRYYVLKTAKGYNERGIASWYGTKFEGRLTSSREPYRLYGMTAASPNLPIPTFVRVTNLQNNRQVIVKVNDRGPFAPNRIIDLSYAAAKKLGYMKKGTALVQVTAINVEHPEATPVADHISNPRLYLQVGAFSYYSNAQRLKSRLATVTHRSIRITQDHMGAHVLYRVRIGPLANVDESDNLVNQLQTKGFGKAYTVIE